MPLLSKEPEAHPDALFALPLESAPWGIAHVRSRREKQLARHLLERDLPYYVPQVEHVTHRAGRTFTSHLILFPGYVFFRGGREVVDLVRRSGVVASIIDAGDQRLFDRELREIRDLQLSGASLRPAPELLPGEPVRITEGPFRGYTGVILRGKTGERLLVQLTALRRAVAVELDRNVLARV